jgi:vacuolar protein sorting-associated protein 13A/C
LKVHSYISFLNSVELITKILVRYLGEYVEGLNREHLRFSLLEGKVEINNLRFKTTALNQFRLPVTVREGYNMYQLALTDLGFLGKLVVKIPAQFGKESVVVQMSQLFLIAQPKEKVEEETEEEAEERLQQLKQEKLRIADEKEEEFLEAKKAEQNQGRLCFLQVSILPRYSLEIDGKNC